MVVNVWFSGSCRVEVDPSSKSQAQSSGAPPDVSRNSTTNGGVPEIVLGEITTLAVKAATGPRRCRRPRGPCDDAAHPGLHREVGLGGRPSRTLPRMFEIIGVMTSNCAGQLDLDVVAEPGRDAVAVVVDEHRSRDDRLAARDREATVGGRGVAEDLVLVPVWTSASAGDPQASGLFAA